MCDILERPIDACWIHNSIDLRTGRCLLGVASYIQGRCCPGHFNFSRTSRTVMDGDPALNMIALQLSSTKQKTFLPMPWGHILQYHCSTDHLGQKFPVRVLDLSKSRGRLWVGNVTAILWRCRGQVRFISLSFLWCVPWCPAAAPDTLRK